MTGIALALLAGVLTTLSPCVLPLVPIVIGTAIGEHRFGPAALAAGLALSFVTIGVTMAAFGVGAALPLLVIGMMSREMLSRWRSRLLAAGSTGKAVMGLVLLATGALVLSGLDKRLEAFLVEASPAWLTELTTRF